MDYASLTDPGLWDLIIAGNRKAYAHVYNSYSSDLLRYGLKFTSDTQLIEDVMHDLWVRIWEKRNKIKINTTIKFYLLTAFRRDHREKNYLFPIPQSALDKNHRLVQNPIIINFETKLISLPLTKNEKA